MPTHGNKSGLHFNILSSVEVNQVNSAGGRSKDPQHF
jgi:hypothetical protein